MNALFKTFFGLLVLVVGFSATAIPCRATPADKTKPALHGAPIYWRVSPDRGLVFDWGEKDNLRRFDHDRRSGRLVEASALSGDVRAEGRNSKGDYVMPGGLISLSANGTRDGLLWIHLPWKGGGRILAYDALSLRRLWDTTVSFPLSHNGPPTVADGRVIVRANGQFLVYGLRGPPQNCQPVVGCNDNVTFVCDIINEIVVLQRKDRDIWHDVSIDSDPSRQHIPFINNSPRDGRNSVLYRICSRNSGDDICTDPVCVHFDRSCSGGGGVTDEPPLPQCGGHPCPHYEQ